ncbi:hypothetical protein FVR03_14015 [Pontibacter qinzhouensis]|uniref:NlpE C-terminal OB domain-containing protein n=1 Tax=Pontibacter qinzhouensis TaxID=2603253 RepID=A0A5C8K3P7_9BACT|nr:hypothetical protein [Pontibacter qinzhouensis]TXK44291.1 hypothetical protein FVR03_14015 [Pontibacter qinzhouensis]
MKTAFRVLLALFTPMVFSACSSSGNTLTEETNATLVWSGEYMADGCGFHLVVNDTLYKPENENTLDEAFKTEEPTAVKVKFERLQQKIDRRCGLSTESRAMEGIRIISIKKR